MSVATRGVISLCGRQVGHADQVVVGEFEADVLASTASVVVAVGVDVEF